MRNWVVVATTNSKPVGGGPAVTPASGPMTTPFAAAAGTVIAKESIIEVICNAAFSGCGEVVTGMLNVWNCCAIRFRIVHLINNRVDGFPSSGCNHSTGNGGLHRLYRHDWVV